MENEAQWTDDPAWADRTSVFEFGPAQAEKARRAMGSEMKPIPEPLYSCCHCRDDYSWPAGDLFWSELDHDWVCDNCWSERDNNWDGENYIETELGVSLANEIKSRRAAPVDGNACTGMCDEFLRTYQAYDKARWFGAGWRRLAQKLDGEWKETIRADLARIADLLERPSVKHHTPNNEVNGSESVERSG